MLSDVRWSHATSLHNEFSKLTDHARIVDSWRNQTYLVQRPVQIHDAVSISPCTKPTMPDALPPTFEAVLLTADAALPAADPAELLTLDRPD